MNDAAFLKVCRGCNVEKSWSEFYSTEYGTPASKCKICELARGREKYHRDRGKERERNRRKRVRHGKRWNREIRERRRIDPEFAKRKRAASLKHNRQLRLLVLRHYGGNPPTCACCGERHLEFLVLDHVNGGGTQHRVKLFGRSVSGTAFFRWVIKNGFPKMFRVLCQNCNSALGHYGFCPHQRLRVREGAPPRV